MTEVLVTGASGVLGRAVVAEFLRRGIAVTGLSRTVRSERSAEERWVRGDLLRPDTLCDALARVDVVVHCASNPRRPEQDVIATGNLGRAARAASHLVYVSIAGIEKAARTFPYYRSKLACEKLVAAGSMPFSVVRSTQFHEFIDFVLGSLQIGPFQLLPSMRIQPVDVCFAADRIVAHALAQPTNRATNVHGLEVLRAEELAATRQRVLQSHKIALRLPAIGMLGTFGRIDTVDGEAGGRTWSTWLSEQHRRPNPYRRS